MLGPESAATIHNILLAGCNQEGRIRSEEIRHYFVNATNITYMAPGELAFTLRTDPRTTMAADIEKSLH